MPYVRPSQFTIRMSSRYGVRKLNFGSSQYVDEGHGRCLMKLKSKSSKQNKCLCGSFNFKFFCVKYSCLSLVIQYPNLLKDARYKPLKGTMEKLPTLLNAQPISKPIEVKSILRLALRDMFNVSDIAIKRRYLVKVRNSFHKMTFVCVYLKLQFKVVATETTSMLFITMRQCRKSRLDGACQNQRAWSHCRTPLP